MPPSRGSRKGHGCTTGIGKYREWFILDVWNKQDGECARCWKHLTARQMLLHHIDHDRHNNVLSNMEGLCKRCHQLEHECGKAFGHYAD